MEGKMMAQRSGDVEWMGGKVVDEVVVWNPNRDQSARSLERWSDETRQIFGSRRNFTWHLARDLC
jgi:hypothetical protein